MCRGEVRHSGLSSNTSTSSSHNTSAAAHPVGQPPLSQLISDFPIHSMLWFPCFLHTWLAHDWHVAHQLGKEWKSDLCLLYSYTFRVVESSPDIFQSWGKSVLPLTLTMWSMYEVLVYIWGLCVQCVLVCGSKCGFL